MTFKQVEIYRARHDPKDIPYLLDHIIELSDDNECMKLITIPNLQAEIDALETQTHILRYRLEPFPK